MRLTSEIRSQAAHACTPICMQQSSCGPVLHGFSYCTPFCQFFRYIYQKGYVEFFCSPEKFQSLRARLDKEPTVTYMAVNAEGEFVANVSTEDVNAVTWGVFPGREVMQPTVVDPHSFIVWKVSLG